MASLIAATLGSTRLEQSPSMRFIVAGDMGALKEVGEKLLEARKRQKLVGVQIHHQCLRARAILHGSKRFIRKRSRRYLSAPATLRFRSVFRHGQFHGWEVENLTPLYTANLGAIEREHPQAQQEIGM